MTAEPATQTPTSFFLAPGESSGATSQFSKPNAIYLQHHFIASRNYYHLCTQVTNPTDPRIENAMFANIATVDDIEMQHYLYREYDDECERQLKRFCDARGLTREGIDNLDYAKIRWSANNIIMGKIEAWFGRNFSLTTPITIGVCKAPENFRSSDWEIIEQNGLQYFNPAQNFAQIVTGKITRDVSQLTVGFRGSGKSEKDLSFAECISMWISWYRDQDASLKGGRNYFNIDMVACIDKDDATKLMEEKSKYIVKVFDDIGVGWNARNYSQKDNKDKNDIFQINRVNRTVQLMSIPDSFLLDKVPRHLISHYCEMVNADAMKERYEWSETKLFLTDKQFRTGKQLTKYPKYRGAVVQRVLYPRASKEIREDYIRIRVEKTRKQQDKENDRLKDESAVKINGHTARAKQRCEKLFPEYFVAREQGVSHSKALSLSGITADQFRNWKANGWIIWDEKEWGMRPQYK